jgi:hypothetical protein
MRSGWTSSHRCQAKVCVAGGIRNVASFVFTPSLAFNDDGISTNATYEPSRCFPGTERVHFRQYRINMGHLKSFIPISSSDVLIHCSRPSSPQPEWSLMAIDFTVDGVQPGSAFVSVAASSSYFCFLRLACCRFLVVVVAMAKILDCTTYRKGTERDRQR